MQDLQRFAEFFSLIVMGILLFFGLAYLMWNWNPLVATMTYSVGLLGVGIMGFEIFEHMVIHP